MELITRHLVRKKGDRELVYQFTTYDFILNYSHDSFQGEFKKLVKHLCQAFTFGMQEAPKSPSEEPELVCKTEELKDHEFSKLADESAYYGKGKSQHLIVQWHFLRNHPDAIAIEVPVWNEEFSGCIDILLYDIKSGRISILDFKPGAKTEKSVSGQLFRYAKLLSERTGIPMDKIDLYYFDGKNTYQVTF